MHGRHRTKLQIKNEIEELLNNKMDLINIIEMDENDKEIEFKLFNKFELILNKSWNRNNFNHLIE